MTIRNRLNRLIGEARRRGIDLSGRCHACRDRQGLISMVTVGQDGDMPDRCEVCGQIPENVLYITEVVVPPRVRQPSA
jgi:hypothetical protein